MSKQFPHPFTEFNRKFSDYRRKLPAKVSIKATEEIKHNFRVGGYRRDTGTIFWKPRKSKQNVSRALLIKTGRLRRSIQPQPQNDFARVITTVHYAYALNHGFIGNVNVRAHKRKQFTNAKGVFSIKTKRAVTRKIKNLKSTGMVKAHQRKVNIPARPFMEVGTPFLNVLERDITNDLDKLFMQS